MQSITPCLWFDGTAEEAANYYVGIFPHARIVSVARYGDVGPGPKGGVMIVVFQLDGQEFLALNGGPQFHFTEAVSFVVRCETQDDVDRFWVRLSDGGAPGQCGWLKDKYGVSWQIVPSVLPELMQSGDAETSKRVMQALLQMRKIDIGKLRQAYDHA